MTIDYRWADGYLTTAGARGRLVRLARLIVTGDSGGPGGKAATATVRSFLTAVGDPVGGGLVASLARPGGNATGITRSSRS